MPFPLAYYQQYFNGPVQAKTILSSDDANDQALVPALGMYAKGNIKTDGLFEGTATSSQLADLAERYHADKDYKEGTLLIIGGEFEVSITRHMGDVDFFGVVSKNPAFRMNEGAGSDKTHPFVALKGRVPVRVIGKIKKGERLVSSKVPGVAMGWTQCDSYPVNSKDVIYTIVGRSLVNKESEQEEIIEAVVGGM